MKSRDPLLYEQLIGQYLTEEDVQSTVKNKDLGFASVLMQHVQALQDNELFNQLKDTEVSQVCLCCLHILTKMGSKGAMENFSSFSLISHLLHNHVYLKTFLFLFSGLKYYG